MRLLDKVAVITGAASGTGKAMAILFAKEGAKDVVSDSSLQRMLFTRDLGVRGIFFCCLCT